jgi:hypothetical protein
VSQGDWTWLALADLGHDFGGDGTRRGLGDFLKD